MTWPFRVLEMNAHHTIVVAHPGYFTVVAVLAIGGMVWCLCGVVEMIAGRMEVAEWE